MYLWKLKRHRNRPSQKERKTSPKVSISIFLYWVYPIPLLNPMLQKRVHKGRGGKGSDQTWPAHVYLLQDTKFWGGEMGRGAELYIQIIEIL